MEPSSQQLADHYALSLEPNWVDWFDDECQSIDPAGAMRSKLRARDLCVAAPPQIWPGFMLPDSLPIIGNDYGDWLCARVRADGGLGELIYWYHGGGDWIPVGNCLAEALLHDAVDQFRGKRAQMLRGAPETMERNTSEVTQRLERTSFQHWIVKQIESRPNIDSSEAQRFLQQILEVLARGQSRSALELMYRFRLAEDAVACDLIELALQSPVEPLAHAEIANQLKMAWYPDYARLMFDIDVASEDLRDRILAEVPATEKWPVQNWHVAGRLSEEVIARRNDLGWAFTVAGWAKQRQGETDAAVEVYWAGQMASSFADQSVRLSSHGFAEQSGKFSIEKLLALRDQLLPERLTEPYFTLFQQPHSRSLLNEVHDFWWQQGLRCHQEADYAAAYDFFFRSGWDLGVSRLSDYARILKALAETATAAGWQARARVAETHLACLNRQ